LSAIELAIDEHQNAKETLEALKLATVTHQTFEISRLPQSILKILKPFSLSLHCDDSTPINDPGREEYEAVQSTFRPTGLIITTHSMLALDAYNKLFSRSGFIKQYGDRSKKLSYKSYQETTRKKVKNGVIAPQYDDWLYSALNSSASSKRFSPVGVLPSPLSDNSRNVVMIDEAHQYADNVELVLSRSVSIDLLLSRLETLKAHSSGATKRLLRSCHESVSQLKTLSQRDSSELIKSTLATHLDVFDCILDINWNDSELQDQLRLNRVQRSVDILKRFGHGSNLATATHSYKKRKLSIESMTDPLALMSILFFTHQSSKSAAYLSGTLNDSSKQYRFAVSSLRLQSTRLKERLTRNPNIQAPWLTANVSLTVVSDFADNESFSAKAWTIFNEIKNRNGGTLVLCNSYSEIEAIKDAFDQCNDKDRFAVIADRKGQNNAEHSELYRSTYLNNIPVIWFTTGSSWVGLDMTDHDSSPEKDNLIETLIITKAPFQSQIPNGKNDAETFYWFKYLQSTMVKFRQGLGRLVRREGRENMHILYLDALYNKRSRKIFKQYLNDTYA
jgi:CRISPR type IV-associated DEAD/DEAH-box helicase Csf4